MIRWVRDRVEQGLPWVLLCIRNVFAFLTFCFCFRHNFCAAKDGNFSLRVENPETRVTQTRCRKINKFGSIIPSEAIHTFIHLVFDSKEIEKFSTYELYCPKVALYCKHRIVKLMYDEIMNIWISYIRTAEWRMKCKQDHRSYRRNFCSCEKKARKQIQASGILRSVHPSGLVWFGLKNSFSPSDFLRDDYKWPSSQVVFQGSWLGTRQCKEQVT